MKTISKMQIAKDEQNKKLNITREFNAPLADVWKAWTERESLDQWWAPKPWKAITKSMNFANDGKWLYAMTGPNGEQSWNLFEFSAINPQKSFETTAIFCDANGVKDSSMPTMFWKNKFFSTDSGTRMEIEISFSKVEDFKKIIEMGFEGGFSMGLENLDELLEK